uniref:Uncharacterized protein n=1 Tax=viral metagenome TaxID=1070528 RepID=A0A6C0HV34_9ZZZZ
MDYEITLDKNTFMAFREDVLDCFHSIIKSIEDDKIQTNVKYNNIMNSLINDFKLYKIMIFINELTNDKEFKKHYNSYKVALDFCDEIMEKNIIKNKLNYYKKKND